MPNAYTENKSYHQRLQRCRPNDILLSQRNTQTYKHLSKHLYGGLQDMPPEPLIDTHTDTLKTIRAFVIAADERWEQTLNMKSWTSTAVLLAMSWWTAVWSWYCGIGQLFFTHTSSSSCQSINQTRRQRGGVTGVIAPRKYAKKIGSPTSSVQTFVRALHYLCSFIFILCFCSLITDAGC